MEPLGDRNRIDSSSTYPQCTPLYHQADLPKQQPEWNVKSNEMEIEIEIEIK